MQAEIISIGTEILMGELVDTNSSFIAAELAKIGVSVRWVWKVGDDPEFLYEAIKQAWQRSDVTITTGGLGPTSDDLTRESIARVFGETMVVQDDLLENLKRQFESRGAPMPETNIKQATLIPSSQVVPNPMGTAPGWWAEKGGHIVVAMPGPPRENEQMWTNEVAPRLKERNPGVAIVTRNIKTFGISEGLLDEMLSPLFQNENPYLGIYSKQDGIHLRAIATAATEVEAHNMIAPVEAEIRRVVAPESIWGLDDDTPASRLASLLIEKGLTLGVMESFTGGQIASSLFGIENSHKFLKGVVVTHHDEVVMNQGVDAAVVDEFGAASSQASEAMAEAARRNFGADIGLSITGVVAERGPASVPVGTSYIGFAVGDQTSSISGRYPTQRLRMRSRAATHAILGLIQAMKG